MMRLSQKRRIIMMNNELMQISKIKICHNKYRFCVEENSLSLTDAINIVDINLLTHKITCSCSDAKSYNNMHMQIICKHGCFILIKVLEMFTENSSFFINMIFTDDDIQNIPNKLLNLHPSLIVDEYDNDNIFNMYDNENSDSDSDSDYSNSERSSLQHSQINSPINAGFITDNNLDGHSYSNTNSKLSSQLKKKIIIKTENKIFLENDMCSVCYEQMTNTPVIKCSHCNNYFHTSCLETWLLNNTSCILCRNNIKHDILHSTNIKCKCECGSLIDSSYMKKHLLTKKHKNFIVTNN